jgi:hypothetical protein
MVHRGYTRVPYGTIFAVRVIESDQQQTEFELYGLPGTSTYAFVVAETLSVAHSRNALEHTRIRSKLLSRQFAEVHVQT